MRTLPYSNRCCRLALLVAVFALSAGAARAEQLQREFVPELNVYDKLSDRTRLYLLADLTRNVTADTTESELGIHLDHTLQPIFRPQLREADWERDRYLWMRVGYLQLGTPDKARTGPAEHRGIIELTGRMPLPQEAWMVHRGRVDLREIGGEFSRRYRYRLGIEREVKIGGAVTVPYAQAEIFYDTRYESWHRRLYQAGTEIELSGHWRMEIYIARQNDERSTSGNVGRVGLVFKYYR